MTHITDLVTEAVRGAHRFPRCTHEQALVYSCEDVAQRHQPLRQLSRQEAVLFVADVCMEEDVDIPHVEFGRRGTRCSAWADRTTHTVWFGSARPLVGTVLHELSHLIARADAHDPEFRFTFLRLVRRHAGIQHAGLLRSLFIGTGLDNDPVHRL